MKKIFEYLSVNNPFMKKFLPFLCILVWQLCMLSSTNNLKAQQVGATALKFDPSLTPGDNSRLNYVSVDNPFRAFQKEMTVEFWMYVPNANLPFGSLMGQGSSNVDNNWVWLMHPNDNGTMTFYVNDNGTLRTTNCTISAGAWHHYAATASATSTKFYIDGVLVHTGAGVSNGILSNSTSVIHIGKDVRYATRHIANGDPWNRYATMTLDEVRIWSRALCQDEIIHNKNGEVNPGIQSGLQQYYRFNQGVDKGNNSTETTLTDLSGNNRNGTLNNFTLNGTASNWVSSGSTNTGILSAFVAPVAPITGATTICLDAGNTTLSNAVSGGKWTSSNLTVATINASTGVVTPLSLGSSTITYTTSCGAISTVTVTVAPKPVVTIAAVGGTLACPGSGVTLNATAPTGSTYLWYREGVLISGATNASYTATVSGSYTSVITNSGCTSSPSNAVAISISDVTNPTIICSANITVPSTSAAGAVVNYVAPVGADNCSVSATERIAGLASGSVFPIGTTTVTYRVTDGSGNAASCSFDVTVTAPTVVASALNFDGQNDFVAINNPFRAFNKEMTVEFWMNAPNALMPYGSVMGQSTAGVDHMTTNVWLMHPNTTGGIDFLVNDAGTWRGATVPIKAGGWHHYVGVASEFGTKFYVDGVLAATGPGVTNGIVNNANSVIHIGKDVRHNTGRFGNSTIDEVRIWNRVLCEAEINNSKDCQLNSLTQTGLQEYYRFNQGFIDYNNSLETTLIDVSGNGRNGQLNNFALTGNNSNWVASGSTNTGTCTNFTPPTAPITGTTSLCIGATSTLLNSITGGLWSSSNISVATINTNTGLVTAVGAGTTTITYRTECGAISTATITVNPKPTVTIAALGSTTVCPGKGVALSATAPSGSTYQWFRDGVVISGAVNLGYIGTVSGSYTSVVTNNGCTSVPSNAVTIVIGDVIKPAITCPPNQTLNLDASCNAVLPDYTSLVTATDNCTVSNELVISQSPAAGTIVNGKGALVITFTVTDASGNNSTCTISIDKKDVTEPVITCPAPIVVNNTANTCGAVVNYINPKATDNCTGGAFNFFNGGEPNNYPNYLNQGEDYIQLYNNATWNDLPNFVLNRSIVEFNSIISTVFSGYTLIGTFGGHTYYYSTGTATWIDSRAAAQAIGGDLASINTLAESQFLALYGGNTWVGGYQDKTVPGFQEPGNANQNFLGWKWVDGTQLGAGQIVITQTAGLPSGSVFPVGVTTNTFTATDESGNTSTCSFTVTVRDVQPPVINCPVNMNVTATSAAGAVVNYTAPVGSDNCSGSVTVRTAGPASGSTFPIGTTTVTYRVTDAAGLTSQCSFTVTVVGVAPVITCPANIKVNAAAGACTANVNFAATETVGIPASVITYTIDGNPLVSGASFPVGTTTVVATATNAVGSSSCSFTVTVADNQNPTITSPANVQANNTPGICTGTVSLGTPVTSDNCGVASVDNDAPTTFPVGITIVTWTVTDTHGNKATATQTVVIVDNEKPTISVTNVNVNNDAGKCGASIIIAQPITADNCGVATVTGVRSDNQLLTADYPVGTTIITWTVKDVNGNSNTTTQTILVSDNEKPVVVCAANQVFCANTGGNTQYTIPALSQSDNCGIASTTYTVSGATNRNGTGTDASGSFAIGTSTVTYTVTDIHGNINTCSFTVTINPLPVGGITLQSPDVLCNQFTLTGTSTLNGPFGYQWLYSNSTKATTQQLSLGLTDADGIYTLFVTDGNGCRSEIGATYNYEKQNLSSNYTLLATKEVKLGHYNKVGSGSVGIMSNRGEAVFKKYSSVTGAGAFVKAPRIETDKSATITNKIYGVATVTLPVMQYNTSSTSYLNDITVKQQAVTTLAGNYDDVTLRKGSNVILTGSVFGKIRLEEGASVKFTSAVVNLKELQIEKGSKSGGYSYVRFAQNTSVRVSKKVTIGNDVIVNPDAYQVTFFLGDNRRDEEKFHVKGDDTRITANIYVPDGKIKVTGGNYGGHDDDRNRCDHRAHSWKDCKHKGHGHHDCNHSGHGDRDCTDEVYMTGIFIAEEIESEGKFVNWNGFNCAAPLSPATAITSTINTATVTTESVKLPAIAVATEEELKITVMPNPTTTYFTLKLESKYDVPVNMRVMDVMGRVIDSRTKLGANATVEVGYNYHAGHYFAEFIQGNRRKVVQLIKIKGR